MAIQQANSVAAAMPPGVIENEVAMQTGTAALPVGEIERETAVAAKGGAGKGVAAKGAATAKAAAGKGAVAPVGGKVVAAAAPVKVAAVGGAATGVVGTACGVPTASVAGGYTMLTGKGVCLGLGLGLGAWGPVILGVVGLAGATTLYEYIKNRRAPVVDEFAE